MAIGQPAARQIGDACDRAAGQNGGMRSKPNDRILQLRRQLAREIVGALGPGAQHTISASYGISQPRMSELERGIVDRCSVEWLILRIDQLGGTVEVTVTVGDVRREWHRERFARMRGRRGLNDRRLKRGSH